MNKENFAMPRNVRIRGDFDKIGAEYPECTDFVTADVTLDDDGKLSDIKATLENLGVTPNGEPRFLLTVWNSPDKPIPGPLGE